MQLTGRRGTIQVDQTTHPRIATKRATHPTHAGAMRKESKILQKLHENGIDFVPQVIDSHDDRFAYHRIDGEQFHAVYKKSSSEKKNILANNLVQRAYELDKVGVLHGELDDPRTNVLVDAHDGIWIVDFERGKIGDFSGKNMRHTAQRLYREGYISLDILTGLGTKTIDEIKCILDTHLLDHAQTMSSRLFRPLILGLLIGVDQLTKWVFYDQQIGADSRLLTPVLNTGIGRSIAIPLFLVIGITILICLGILRAWGKYPQYRRIFLLALAGAIGNLIDRGVYAGVRDFIDLHYRPIFNLADIYLSLAIVMLVWQQYTVSHYFQKKSK